MDTNVEKEYVAGFLFSADGKRVALIKKLRPKWQRGKLNGIGGKVEHGESPLQAMRREFREETGADIEQWRLFCSLHFDRARIHFFVATCPSDDIRLQSITDEPVSWYTVDVVRHDVTIPNLRWLVPMAADTDNVEAVVKDPSW